MHLAQWVNSIAWLMHKNDGLVLQGPAWAFSFGPRAFWFGGDLDILIPNSINRLRVKGAGSHFVQGCASLQEIVVSVVRVGKSR